MNLFIQLVYHPLAPQVIVPALSEAELNELEREGYKWVKLKRIGNILRRGRKLSGAGTSEFLEYLAEHHIFITQDTLYSIERGEASFNIVTISLLQNLARALRMPLEDLVRAVPRGQSRAKEHIPVRQRKGIVSSIRLKTFKVTLSVQGETFNTAWTAYSLEELRKQIREQFESSTVVDIALVQSPELLYINSDH